MGAYTQAYEVVRRSLGPQHHLTKTFERSTRCPHRVKSLSKPKSARGPVVRGQRLPNIPNSKRCISALPDLKGYDLNDQVFAPWPPESATREEHLWYSMARPSAGRRYGVEQQRQHQLLGEAFAAQVRNGVEPTLEALGSNRTPSR